MTRQTTQSSSMCTAAESTTGRPQDRHFNEAEFEKKIRKYLCRDGGMALLLSFGSHERINSIFVNFAMPLLRLQGISLYAVSLCRLRHRSC